MQADVADEEETRVVLVAQGPGAAHRGEIQPRLGQLRDVLDRQVGQRTFVLLAVEGETVRINRIRDLRQRLALAAVPAVLRIQVPARALAVALVGGEKIRQLAVTHAEEFDVDILDVDRHHRQSARIARRQHAALRGESGCWFHRTSVDVAIDRLAERLAVRSGDRVLDAHRVSRVGLDVGETQGLAVFIQRPTAVDHAAFRVLDLDQGVEGLRTGEAVREFQRDRELALELLRMRRGEHESLRRLVFRLPARQRAPCPAPAAACFPACRTRRAGWQAQQHMARRDATRRSNASLVVPRAGSGASISAELWRQSDESWTRRDRRMTENYGANPRISKPLRKMPSVVPAGAPSAIQS